MNKVWTHLVTQRFSFFFLFLPDLQLLLHGQMEKKTIRRKTKILFIIGGEVAHYMDNRKTSHIQSHQVSRLYDKHKSIWIVLFLLWQRWCFTPAVPKQFWSRVPSMSLLGWCTPKNRTIETNTKNGNKLFYKGSVFNRAQNLGDGQHRLFFRVITNSSHEYNGALKLLLHIKEVATESGG